MYTILLLYVYHIISIIHFLHAVGVKEKTQRHNMECKVPKNCDYQNLCNRFKSFLALPGKLFTVIH